MGSVDALEGMAAIYPEIRKRGIRALPGGDYGFPNNPIGRNARDLGLFVDILGYSPVEVLTAATKYGGQLMGMGDELGLLAPGYLADLLVVEGDPTADVTVLEDPDNIAYIVQAGSFYKQPAGATRVTQESVDSPGVRVHRDVRYAVHPGLPPAEPGPLRARGWGAGGVRLPARRRVARGFAPCGPWTDEPDLVPVLRTCCAARAGDGRARLPAQR